MADGMERRGLGDPGAPVKFGLGQSAPRLEDRRFLTGAGRYVDDMASQSGAAVAVLVRSPVAHAIIRSVDVADARSAPGVLMAATAADLATFGVKPLGNRSPVTGVDGQPPAPVDTPLLATDRLRYVGQPIALIVAETRRQAEDAAERVEVDFEELPAVADPRAAIADDAPQLHDAAPGNISLSWNTGDQAAVDAAFAKAATTVRLDIKSQRLIVNAMEPRAVLAQHDAETDRWTIHCTTQGSHPMRLRLAETLDVEPDRIRVVTPDVGGGFGMKLMIHGEYPLAMIAARRLGRPVAWTATRSESFLSDAQARDLTTDAEAAFDADGRFLAMRLSSLSSHGAYFSQFGVGVHSIFSGTLAGGMYRVPCFTNAVRGVFTNTSPVDAYRGAGRPEIIYITERLIEAGARATGLDPVEIRRRNLLTAADMPHDTSAGTHYDSGDCVETMEQALALADWEGREARRAEAEARGRLFGAGVAYYMERTGGGPVENARIRIRADGRVDAWVGTQSTGQGHETAWAQLIGHKLGVAPEAIDFLPGDSDLLPAGGGTGGSRSLIMAHRTFFLAADDVIEQGRRIAAERLEAAEADIEFEPVAGGAFRVAGTDRVIGLADVAAAADASDGQEAGEILGVGTVTERTSTYPNGAHVAEVEIDPETGVVTLTRFTAADDFGRILNPMLVAGQVHGGAVQGIGQALMEQAVYDPETAQPLAGSFMDYAMPRAGDLPMMATRLSDHAPATTNPMGVKGCGEAGAVGGTPSLAAAIRDALARVGVDPERVETPFTPVKIWTALQGAKLGSGEAA